MIRPSCASCMLSVLLLVSGAFPQYFGRNKVQYDTFEFLVLETDNLNVLYYPKMEPAASDAARMLERWYARLREIFDRPLPNNQPIILYANHADFQQTNAIGGLIPQSTGGVTEGFMNRVIVPLTGVYAENDHVLGHELVHAFHFEMLRTVEGGMARSGEIPLWFIEGMSEYLSIGTKSPLTAMWMRDAVLHDEVPTFRDVGSSYRYFPYRFGHSIWAFMSGEYGDRINYTLFAGVLRHGWYPGYRRILGSTVDSVSTRWGRMLKEHFGPTLEGRTLPGETGQEIIVDGGMNLAPSISPDGSLMAFISSRDIFSMDLFLADARSGSVVRKLVSSESDEHFDALRSFNSSGAWSPDGERLAFVVFREGRNEIGIVEVSNGRMEKPFALEGVDEITGISWSPDGRRLAVAGTYGAIGNLYLYDFSEESTIKLTDDKFAALQPTWSPGGSHIAFVTDRGSFTNFDNLTFGPLQVGLYSLETGEVRLISIAPWAKHINPQFSPDGENVYMVADPDGVSDIYRYSLSDGVITRITRVATGISGLSENSPAMSVASKSGEMVFSIFNKGEYQVRGMQTSELHGQSFSPDKDNYDRVVKLRPEPAEDVSQIVDTYLEQPGRGLPDTSKFSIDQYGPKLRLLYVGQLYAGVAADRYGVGVGGGASFLFSDLLGDHLMGLSAQINGSLRDVGGQGVYINRRGRLNWGLALGRVPYYSSRLQVQSDSTGLLYTITEQRVYENRLSGFFEYPFSMGRRIELGASYTRYSYNYEAENLRVTEGRIDSREPVTVENPLSINLFQSSAAYVGDFSFFGFTAPVSGRRFRLEVEPTFGTLNFVAALADYRQYLFRYPFTLAYRLFHYGRYLGDSETDRLSPLFVGYETWVRGYSAFTFDLRGCGNNGDFSNCPEFDRLIGSRLGIVNVELRLPLLGTEQFGLVNFPYLPLDLAAFLDGGVAWTASEMPVWKWDRTNSTDRIPVFSAGGAARVNLFGLLVMQIYYAYPFQRPGYGGHWGFLIAPGW